MSNQQDKCVGFIQLQFFDSTTDQVVSLGGAWFMTKAEDDAAWVNIPVFEGETAFMADRLDGIRDIVDEKPVSAETCEKLMGQPIAVLISEGRAQLKAYLESLT
ncbi:TPA: hypothetical protein NIF38_000699 [Pseudomonas aeruginosa]|uniref:hypothetical protein n=1 Tax=Pseudomonas aeruginosa TaxID=287 RepID=UPI000FD6142E|nr:hypothetical protein [Pseudomonas aeruginosa]RUG15328.1 hypothetical protein IPC762_26155 [Pseudomonas aeruginosa]HCF4721598.1 hypothetical protein [Pseudomonas aeruginosa]